MKSRLIVRIFVVVITLGVTSTSIAQHKTESFEDSRDKIVIKNVLSPSETFLRFVDDIRQNEFVEFCMPKFFYDVHPIDQKSIYPYPFYNLRTYYYFLSYDGECEVSYPGCDYWNFYSPDKDISQLKGARHLPDRIAKKNNADVVFIREVTLSPKVAKYSYCTTLSICKQDRPIIRFQILFTDKGKKDEQRYIKQILRSVKYLDDGGQMKEQLGKDYKAMKKETEEEYENVNIPSIQEVIAQQRQDYLESKQQQ